MKVVQINATCGSGSTGKICLSISKLLSENKIENYIFYSQGKSNYQYGIKFSNKIYGKIQAFSSRVFGNSGFNSRLSTLKLIKQLNNINPDIIHLHNIHSNDCNLDILFSYIKQNNIKLFWTFHDCWAFTGNCTHFLNCNCDKWKNQCECCPQTRKTSWFFDKSNQIFNRKKRLFSSLDLTIITPSEWLASLVKESFLKNYPTYVINNGIDLTIFKPLESNFRTKYNLEKNFIILGVAFPWSNMKGLDVFIELSKSLSKDIKIVLVGTDSKIDSMLPNNIISIHKTENQIELAKIYSASDVFINVSKEENYPTVNMEAIACGTPVLTFDTGGSKEMLDSTCGDFVTCDDIDSLVYKIKKIWKNNYFNREDCLIKAETFKDDLCFSKYLDLYLKEGKKV